MATFHKGTYKSSKTKGTSTPKKSSSTKVSKSSKHMTKKK